ncbi:SURF1 family protein [Dictyocaulus viviparus]|uniref:SURF1 family protein n=1 Tax=Dictyocaulus viviparus TaxID=29172 RepID=A0A0D8XJR3_DICVI|nr:SURF1 family protein [Dictyocaulus viviparus]
MNTSFASLPHLWKISFRTSFEAALSRRRDKEVIRLDSHCKKDKNSSENEGSRRSKKTRRIQWSFGSYAMLSVPVTTFCLGCWQIYRLQWKLNLIEKLKDQLNEPAVDFPLDNISKLNAMEYRKVRVTGEFLHDREFYISPRGRFDPGYMEQGSGSVFSNNISSHGAHVITPFRLTNSEQHFCISSLASALILQVKFFLVILINRGWVPTSKTSPLSHQLSQPKGIVTLNAVVRKSETRPRFIKENVPEKGQWFYKNVYQMAKFHNTDPIYLEATYDSTIHGGPIGGQTNINIRNDHLSYLLTWFSLSAITLAMKWLNFMPLLCETTMEDFQNIQEDPSDRVCLFFYSRIQAYVYMVLLMELLNCYLCEANEVVLPVEWMDPNDPTTSRDSRAVNELISKNVKVELNYDPTLRLIIRQIFKELNVNPSEKTSFSRLAKISLSSRSMRIIGSYLEMETTKNELLMREQVRGALQNMIEVYEDNNSISAWEEITTMIRPWISLLNMIVLPPALLLILKSMMSSRSLWTCVLSIFFVISMVTTYNRIYQEKLALRIAESMKRKEDACAPNGLFDQTLEYLSSFVTFQKKSPCLSFIESQTVSIVSDISLLDVLSDVLSNSIFGVLGHLGRHTNNFFREFYGNVPIPAMLLMTVTLILTTIRIKTPLFTMEPMFFSTIHYIVDKAAKSIDSTNVDTEIQGIEEVSGTGDRNHDRERAILRDRRCRAVQSVGVTKPSQPLGALVQHSRSSSRSSSNPR